MRISVRALMLSVVLATFSTNALASAIYQYTGDPYGPTAQITDNNPPAGAYDPSMRIQITLELAEPLAPNLSFGDVTGTWLSFTASDGRSVISDANWDPGSTWFAFTTDAGGNIIGWTTVVTEYIQSPPGGWQIGDISSRSFVTAQPGGTANAYMRACATVDCTSTLVDEVDVNFVGSGGSWSLVPEPSSAVLVGVGLAALAAQRRRS